MPHVAGLEPAVGGEDLRRLPRVVVVAAHDVRAAHEYLALRVGLDFDAGERQPDRADAIIFGTVRRDDARLGHAVALKNPDPSAEEGVGERGRKRRAAGDEEAQPTADALAPLREDEPARDLLLNLKQRRNLLALVSEFGVTLPDAQGPVEKLRLPAALRRPLLDDSVEDLLEEARHGGHDRGPHFAQVLGDHV